VKRQAANVAALALLAGCASLGPGKPDPSPGAVAEGARSPLRALEDQNEAQAARIAELEARLGLLEQEARQYRDAAPTKPSETVRIGGERGSRRDDAAEALPQPTAIVRLDETDLAAARGQEEPLLLPEPPPGVPTGLSVVPLPEQRAARGTARHRSSHIDARAQYRAALRQIRDRQWDAAFDALSGFLSVYADDPLAASATYWRGEVQYAQRRYGAALQDFELVLARFAGSEKAADALLKVGMCHQRLGDGASAERYFRLLREQYPSSDAARIASLENPS
jgi:tol-pal system protein YbgF